MKYDNFLKTMVLLLFVIFIVIFISEESGYYEYRNSERKEFTEEKIREFEKDVAAGKNVNINDYLKVESKDYSNKLTKIGDDISDFVFNTINTLLKESFKLLEKIIN